MSTLSILSDSDPRLREKSAEVADLEVAKIWSSELHETLQAHPTGVALAAPQVGVMLRMFVIRKRVAAAAKVSHTMINPEWSPFGQREPMGEGCLSFDGVRVTKARYRAVKVTYTDLNGKRVTKTVTDKLIAQIIQHEVEHLQGILLTDKAGE